MSRRHPDRGRQRITPTPRAQQLLREDYPAAVKAALVLAVRGARRPTRCQACGGRSVQHVNVWVPTSLLRVAGASGTPVRYGLCARCHATLTPETLDALLMHAAGHRPA